jgi:hypothetical protein
MRVSGGVTKKKKFDDATFSRVIAVLLSFTVDQGRAKK